MTSKPPQPLPKFGEWDVKNPSSADGFTVIFAKARDEKKTNETVTTAAPQKNSIKAPPAQQQHNRKSEVEPTNSRFCCF